MRVLEAKPAPEAEPSKAVGMSGAAGVRNWSGWTCEYRGYRGYTVISQSTFEWLVQIYLRDALLMMNLGS